MIWKSGPDEGRTYFNESWVAFTGRTLVEQLGDGWSASAHADDLAQCLEVYHSAFEARREFQMSYRLRRYDGEHRWILDIGTPEWDSGGHFLGYVGSCVDITDARRLGARTSAKPSPGWTSGAPPLPEDEGVAVTADVVAGQRVALGETAAALTRRERDVVVLLAGGLSNRQIAAELVISVGTVRVHVDHILAKLQLHSRAQVAAWAGQQGLRADHTSAAPSEPSF